MAPAKPRNLRPEQKLSPKLRVAMNGKFAVNAVRCEFSGSLCIAEKIDPRKTPRRRTALDIPLTAEQLPRKPAVTKITKTTDRIKASVFAECLPDEMASIVIKGETARRGDTIIVDVPLDQLKSIAGLPGITRVSSGDQLNAPDPITTTASAPGAPAVPAVGLADKHKNGADTLIGIIDVGGIDFAHPDFLDAAGGTRFVRIWDQGGNFRPPPGKINNFTFDYGAEFSNAHLDAAIAAAGTVGVAATDLEPQSQQSVGSHATHVASIAGGNSGIAPAAALAAVLIDIPEEDQDRRHSFFDSTRLVHAVEYLVELAKRENNKKLSINISLGTNGQAHDGSMAVSRWIDALLATEGHSVCVAAGNAGQERPLEDGDFGFITGRIHTSGRIPADGLQRDIEWFVAGNGIADLSENELEIWYGAQDRIAVSVRPPGMDWIGPVAPREFIENRQLPDQTFLSIFNDIYNPSNGANYIAIYLSPFFGSTVLGVRAGTWTVRLEGLDIRDGRFDGWIERDDPRRLGPVGGTDAWLFPSFFTPQSNVDDSSISSLGCGRYVIAVANLDEPSETVNISSSQGPTRDERQKPELCAPGTGIVAAKGFAGPDDLWTAKTGTSMASPYVAGVAALMLTANPHLTATQISGIMRRTARPLPGTDFNWRNDSGFGAIDPDACVAEALIVNERQDLDP